MGSTKDDMKKVLVTSTMSQTGYMMLAAAPGPVGTVLVVFHLITHSFFKVNMFFGIESVIHAMDDEVDTRRFGGPHKRLSVTWVTFLVGYFTIIDFPFFSGYFSKDKVIKAAFVGRGRRPWVFDGLMMAVAGLIAFYMSRPSFMVFRDEEWFTSEGAEAKRLHEAPATMCVPQILLTMGSIGLDFVLNTVGLVEWFEPVIGPAAHGEPTLPISTITLGTLVLVAAGAGAAWRMYAASPIPTRAPEGNALVYVARVDLYQDAFNENAFTKPSMVLTSAVAATGARAVDGAVEGVAKRTSAIGRLSTRLQNGYVHTYASYTTFGVVIVLVAALMARL